MVGCNTPHPRNSHSNTAFQNCRVRQAPASAVYYHRVSMNRLTARHHATVRRRFEADKNPSRKNSLADNRKGCCRRSCKHHRCTHPQLRRQWFRHKLPLVNCTTRRRTPGYKPPKTMRSVPRVPGSYLSRVAQHGYASHIPFRVGATVDATSFAGCTFLCY